MSKIKELIKAMCPNGIEYKKLEECCNILDNRRKPVKKGDRKEGKYPYYGANGIQDYVSEYIFDGRFVLVGEDGSVITNSGNPVVNWAEGKIWVNNHAHVIEEIDGIMLRYLFHYIQTIDVSDLIHGNIPKLNQSDFRNLTIAIPPIKVQEKIVKILDKFSELRAELEAELEARKQQYAFWSKKLLNRKSKNMIKMNDICINITSGKCYDRMENGKYPVYGSTGIISATDSYSFDEEKILIARVGANAGYVHIAKGKYDVTDNTLIINLKKDYNMKYIYYYLQNFNLNKMAKGGGQPLITAKQIKELEINLPLAEEQEKIVIILDQFDKLVNDILEGLPAEIELRKQQYEYYRNELLGFKEVIY